MSASDSGLETSRLGGTGGLDEVGRYRHGRVPRPVRERQILGLAEELFSERGYTGASMDELARRAGVSKPLIYELFESKEGLHRRLIERAADELAACVAAATASEHDPMATFRAGAVAFFHFIDGHRAAWAMLYADEGGAPHTAHLNDIRARQNAMVIALLRDRAERKGRQIDARRLEAAVHAVNGAFEWLAHWWRVNPGVPAETLADWLMELVYPGLARLLGDEGSGLGETSFEL